MGIKKNKSKTLSLTICSFSLQLTNKLEIERHLSLIMSCGLQTLKVGLFYFFSAPMEPACVVLICFFLFCFIFRLFVCLFLCL